MEPESTQHAPTVTNSTIVIVASLAPFTGNCVTAQRLQRVLSTAGNCAVSLIDVTTTTPAEFDVSLRSARPALIVALHAVRAGRLLLDSPASHSIPLIVILGGTDANHYFEEDPTSNAVAVMQWAFALCKYVVCFNDTLAARYVQFCSSSQPASQMTAQSSKLKIVRQAVDVDNADQCSPETCDVAPRGSLRGALGVPSSAIVVLLVAGLRQVKDPSFLCDAMRAWHAADNRVHLVIVGPVLEQVCADTVWNACGRPDLQGSVPAASPIGDGRAGIWYHAPVPRHQLLHWMSQCSALVNTSISEGQSNAVLEAMALGTPVVVRCNEGNRSIVEHGTSGLVFETAAQAVELLKSVVVPSSAGGDATALRRKLKEGGLAAVQAGHSAAIELMQWRHMLESAAVPSTCR